MTIYVFDMDGTLTPARLPMEADFANRFCEWQKTHKSFIATGSDYLKVEEQLPDFVINAFTGLFTSMGNVLTAQGQQIYQNNFKADLELLADLEKYRQNTEYTGGLYPNYIEERIGMINFSVLGRNCPYEEREKYSAWDKQAGEREKIARELQKKFPQYEISVGGSISIDITRSGCGKGQIAKCLREKYPSEKIIFFGDKTFEGGNDYELAEALLKYENTEVIQVSGREDVEKYLQI